MANPRVLNFSSLTGGGAGALDSINTAVLENETHAKVDTGEIVYTYVYDSTSILSENAPFVITPDSGSGRWILSTAISKHDVGQNLLTNSGFGVCSNSTLENIGTQISVSDITAGVCTTANTEDLIEGKLVEFGASGSTANKVFRVTAVTLNTNFTLNDTSITDATAVTCYESTPACIAVNTFGPDGWYKSSTLDLYREHNGSNTKDGSFYAVKCVKGSDNLEVLAWPLSVISTSPFHYLKYRGRTVVTGRWVESSDADSTRLHVYDGVDNSYSDYHTGGGDYEWLEVSHSVNIANTRFEVRLRHEAGIGTTGRISYSSQPMLKFGSVIGEGNYSQPVGEIVWFDKNYVGLNDYVSKTVSANEDIDIESQTNGAIPKGFRAINCMLSGSCATVAKYLSLGTAGLANRQFSQVANVRGAVNNWVKENAGDGKIVLARDDTFNGVQIFIQGVQIS